MNESDKEKLTHEAIQAFISEFKPLDKYSIALLDIIFELLMAKKVN